MKFNIDQAQAEQLASNIKILLLDVDGVLTDGCLYYSAAGEELKVFNTLDGHGLKLLRRSGVRTGIISGRDSAPLRRRAEELGMDLIYLGREDKARVWEEIVSGGNYPAAQMAYAGDDLPDLPLLRRAGLSFAVPNAHRDIRQVAMVETSCYGGQGAVREICDFLLLARGVYPEILAALQ